MPVRWVQLVIVPKTSAGFHDLLLKTTTRYVMSTFFFFNMNKHFHLRQGKGYMANKYGLLEHALHSSHLHMVVLYLTGMSFLIYLSC